MCVGGNVECDRKNSPNNHHNHPNLRMDGRPFRQLNERRRRTNRPRKRSQGRRGGDNILSCRLLAMICEFIFPPAAGSGRPPSTRQWRILSGRRFLLHTFSSFSRFSPTVSYLKIKFDNFTAHPHQAVSRRRPGRKWARHQKDQQQQQKASQLEEKNVRIFRDCNLGLFGNSTPVQSGRDESVYLCVFEYETT